MNRGKRWIVAAALAVVVVGAGAGVAVASSDDDASDTPITGSALDRASAAALERTGEGKVTGDRGR